MGTKNIGLLTDVEVDGSSFFTWFAFYAKDAGYGEDDYLVGHGGQSDIALGPKTTEAGVNASEEDTLTPAVLRDTLCTLLANSSV